MPANPSSPDELDKLFAALVRAVRNTRPELLVTGLDVADLINAVPYKVVRGEIGAATDDDYGHTITRLLSGERGLLFVDDLMQDDLVAELQSKNPDLQAYRAYLNSRVTLAQERVREVLDALGPAPAREAVATAPATSPATSPAGPPGTTAPKPAAAKVPTAAADAPAKPKSAAAPNRDRPIVQKPRPVPNAIALVAGGVEARSARPGCKYCGQPLPHGRDIKFCPHCGQDLSLMRCAACSAELEPGWKFCVACGRAASQ